MTKEDRKRPHPEKVSRKFGGRPVRAFSESPCRQSRRIACATKKTLRGLPKVRPVVALWYRQQTQGGSDAATNSYYKNVHAESVFRNQS